MLLFSQDLRATNIIPEFQYHTQISLFLIHFNFYGYIGIESNSDIVTRKEWELFRSRKYVKNAKSDTWIEVIKMLMNWSDEHGFNWWVNSLHLTEWAILYFISSPQFIWMFNQNCSEFFKKTKLRQLYSLDFKMPFLVRF